MKQFPGSLEFRRQKEVRKNLIIMSKVILLEKKIQVDKSNIVKNMDYGRLMSFSTFFMVKIITLNKNFTVKLRAVDWFTIQFWTLFVKGHNT